MRKEVSYRKLSTMQVSYNRCNITPSASLYRITPEKDAKIEEERKPAESFGGLLLYGDRALWQESTQKPPENSEG